MQSEKDDFFDDKFDKPQPTDTALQSAARESGWVLSELVDGIAFEKRQQVVNIINLLSAALNSPAQAALSTDAEPDGWICEDEFTLDPDKAWEWEDRGLSTKPFYFSPQQPVKTAPAVAVKALQELHAAEHAKLGVMLLDKSEDGKSQANWQGGRVNGITAAIAALSAQVQDNAEPPICATTSAAEDISLTQQVQDVAGPNTSLLREALEAIVSGGNKPELSIHDLQRNRYSKWAVDIARAALAASPSKQEG